MDDGDENNNNESSPAAAFGRQLQNCKTDLFNVMSSHRGDAFRLNELQETFFARLPQSMQELAHATYALRRRGRRRRGRNHTNNNQQQQIDTNNGGIITAVQIQEANMVRMVGAMLERHCGHSSARDTMRFIAASIQQSLRVLSNNPALQKAHCMMELLVDSTKYNENLSNVDWETSLFHLPAILKAGARKLKSKRRRRPKGLFSQDHYSDDEDDDVWKTVYVYVLCRLAYDELRRLQQQQQLLLLGQQQPQRVDDFDLAQLQQGIFGLLSVDKTLRCSQAADAGTKFFLVDLLIDKTLSNTAPLPDGLSLNSIPLILAGDGRGYGALTYVAELTGLHYYAVAAFIAQRFMTRLGHLPRVAETCEVILHSHNDHCLYLDSLQQQQESSSSPPKEEEEQDDGPDFASVAFPLKIELDVLLNLDYQVNAAIGVATEAEKCTAITLDDKSFLYSMLWRGLLRAGLLFYDRNIEDRRLLLANCFVPHAGKIGIDVFSCMFFKLIENLKDCQKLPEGWSNYVKTISQQALLRLLLNRYPIPGIPHHYAKLAEIPAYTTKGISDWAKNFLEYNPETPNDWDLESIGRVERIIYGGGRSDDVVVVVEDDGDTLLEAADSASTGLLAVQNAEIESAAVQEEAESRMDIDQEEEPAGEDAETKEVADREEEKLIDVDQEREPAHDHPGVDDKVADDTDEEDEVMAEEASPVADADAETSSLEGDTLPTEQRQHQKEDAAAEEYLEYQDGDLENETGIHDDDDDDEVAGEEGEDSAVYSSTSSDFDEETSSEGSGRDDDDDDNANEGAQQEGGAEVYVIDDSSEESVGSQEHHIAEDADLPPPEDRASMQPDNVDDSVRDQDANNLEEDDDETMAAEQMLETAPGLGRADVTMSAEQVVQQALESEETAHKDAEDGTAAQGSPTINSAAAAASVGVPRAQEIEERQDNVLAEGETVEDDVEMQEEDDRKMPSISVPQNDVQDQESLSQLEEGYDAEESQDAATEEEYDRPHDSILQRTRSQTDSSADQAQGVSSGEAVEVVGVSFEAPPAQAVASVDPGYDAEDSQAQTDADDPPTGQIAKKSSFEAGYLGGDSQCPTEEEEEISEANQTTEDEDDQRKKAASIQVKSRDDASPVQQQPEQPVDQGDNTLSDMDAADEDSELDGLRASGDLSAPAVAAPYYSASATTGQRGQSLQDFAAAAQKDDDTRRQQQQAETESQVQPPQNAGAAAAAMNPLAHAQPVVEQEIVDHVPEEELAMSAHQHASDSTATTAGSNQDMSIETASAAMEVDPTAADVLQDNVEEEAEGADAQLPANEGSTKDAVSTPAQTSQVALRPDGDMKPSGDSDAGVAAKPKAEEPNPSNTNETLHPTERTDSSKDADVAAKPKAEEPNPSTTNDTLHPTEPADSSKDSDAAAKPKAEEEPNPSNNEGAQLRSPSVHSPSQSPPTNEEGLDSGDNVPAVDAGTPSKRTQVSSTTEVAVAAPRTTPTKRKIHESLGSDTQQRKVARKEGTPSVGAASRPESSAQEHGGASSPHRKHDDSDDEKKKEETIPTTPTRSTHQINAAVHIESPAFHTRSHDPKEEENESDDNDGSSSEDDEQQAQARISSGTEPATQNDTPAVDTRSHEKEEKMESDNEEDVSSSEDDKQQVDDPEASINSGTEPTATQNDTPAVDTRSHDEKEEKKESDNEEDVSSSDDEQMKETPTRDMRRKTTASSMESPAAHSRSHDAKKKEPDSDVGSSSSSDEEETPGTPARRTTTATSMESPAAHTRSHDAKEKEPDSDVDGSSGGEEETPGTPARGSRRTTTATSMDSPAVHTRSHDAKKKNYDSDNGSSSSEEETPETPARKTNRARATAKSDSPSVSASTRSRRSTRSSSKKVKNDSDDEDVSASTRSRRSTRSSSKKVKNDSDDEDVSASTRSRRSTRSSSKKVKNDSDDEDEGGSDDESQAKKPPARRTRQTGSNSSVSASTRSRRSTRSDSRKRKVDEAEVDDNEQESLSTRRSSRIRTPTAKGAGYASTPRRTTRSKDTASSSRKTRSRNDDDDSSTRAVQSRNTRTPKRKDDDDSSMQTRTGRKKRATSKPPLPPSTRSTRSTRSQRK